MSHNVSEPIILLKISKINPNLLKVAIYLPQVGPDFLPFVIMGGSAICGGILSLLLPETLGAVLPETLDEVGLLKDNDKGFFQCWSKAKLEAKMQEKLEKVKR